MAPTAVIETYEGKKKKNLVLKLWPNYTRLPAYWHSNTLKGGLAAPSSNRKTAIQVQPWEALRNIEDQSFSTKEEHFLFILYCQFHVETELL